MMLRQSWMTYTIAAAVTFHAAAAGAIVGGALDGNAHPNAAAWVYYDPDGLSQASQIYGPGPIVLCSGVLIHERVVLTAGHCVANIQGFIDAGLADERVLFVTFNPDANAVDDYRAVQRISGILTSVLNKPSKVVTKNANDDIDIGAIVLADPVTDITPATLPAANFLDSLATVQLHRASYEVVGYGSTGGLNPKDPALGETDGQRRVGFPQFLNIQTNFVLFQENTNAGNSGHCYLDSGGPTFLVDSATEDQIVITVTSASSGLSPCNSTGRQFRLDIQPSIDFIQSVIAGL